MLLLIVEDDDRVARFLRRGMQEEGWIVDRCVRGEEALPQGLSQPYDLIILDWSLPGMDGIEVLRRWRGAGLAAPVIMLTARTGVDAAVLSLDAGADDYLEKPFSFEELLARIRARLRRTGESPSGRVLIGGSELDLRRRLILRGTEEIELTAREFALLDVLLRHRGEVLSRSLLLDRVWGVSRDPSTNIVDVYIRYLRTKLDAADGADSVIETVRGQGYRLRAEATP